MNAYALREDREQAQAGWLATAAPYLDRVERVIEASIASDVPAAYDLSMHLFSAGGKRIRPALTVLSALVINESAELERTFNLGAAIELVHMASLVHDDVIDETSERRGAPTANSKWGNKLSVLGGDFLLSKAFTLIASDADREIIRTLSSAAVSMTEGELLQASSEGDLEAWKTHYWDIIRGKTAEFMSVCCKCGAIAAGADSAGCTALADYGLQIGYAFQITDDLLDITGNPSVTGKMTGTDLVNGKFTLPVLLALEHFDAREEAILAVSGTSGITREQALLLAKRVAACGAVDKAKQMAVECAEKAVAHLSCLPESEFKSALESLAASITSRTV